MKDTTELFQDLSIDIPKIVIVPKGKVVAGYEDFDLDTSNIKLQSVAQDILIQHLHDMQRYRLHDGSGVIEEKRPVRIKRYVTSGRRYLKEKNTI